MNTVLNLTLLCIAHVKGPTEDFFFRHTVHISIAHDSKMLYALC